MGKTRAKIPVEVKQKYAKLCSEGKMTLTQAEKVVGVCRSLIREWVYRYEAGGDSVFFDTGKRRTYPNELKRKAVLSYLNDEGSLRKIAAKYGLRSETQLRSWILMYNNGKDFTDKESGGSRMSTSRTTSREERVKIVKECLENGRNYKEVADKYNVSYQQVYNWVKRYVELDEAGLEDRRGQRKAKQKPRNELERLQIENARLRQQLYLAEMERNLLKKVAELEKSDPSRK